MCLRREFANGQLDTVHSFEQQLDHYIIIRHRIRAFISATSAA
jgi:hypothetical protein